MFSQRRDGSPVLIAEIGTRLERVTTEAGTTDSFDEAWLQKMLFEHPETLPIQEIEPAFDRLVSICRELPTERGPLDNLFMTGRGDIVLVEAKLWRNPEARRQVVAQALDYATAIFGMSYSDFEAAALRADWGGRPKPSSLYKTFAEMEVLAEPEFIEAVSLNLRRGRMVILVVGDGIRSEAERLADGLQSHAGFHFTFALVEMAVFKLPTERGGLIVLPRTLAKTTMIERGIVRIEGGLPTIVQSAPPTALKTQRVTGSITAETFFEAMATLDRSVPDRLKSIIARLEPLGVYPDFQQTLHFRWDPPEGRTISLGYIQKNGATWFDTVHNNVPDDLASAYLTELAEFWDATLDRLPTGPWRLRKDGSGLKINEIGPALERWPDAIEHLVTAMQAGVSQRVEA